MVIENGCPTPATLLFESGGCTGCKMMVRTVVQVANVVATVVGSMVASVAMLNEWSNGHG